MNDMIWHTVAVVIMCNSVQKFKVLMILIDNSQLYRYDKIVFCCVTVNYKISLVESWVYICKHMFILVKRMNTEGFFD